MNAITIKEKNNIALQIKLTSHFIDRDLQTIQRLKLNDSYSLPQVEKLKQNINNKTTQLEQLTTRLRLLESGQLSEELSKKAIANAMVVIQTNDIKLAKKHKIDEDKKISTGVMKKYEQSNWKDDKSLRYMRKEMDKSYRYYWKVIDEQTPYMKTNLNNMANNKGYIWRGVHFYGKKKTEGNDTVMFERKGNKTHIHTWDEYEYRLSEKIGNTKKKPTLISKKPRRKVAQQEN